MILFLLYFNGLVIYNNFKKFYSLAFNFQLLEIIEFCTSKYSHALNYMISKINYSWFGWCFTKRKIFKVLECY